MFKKLLSVLMVITLLLPLTAAVVSCGKKSPDVTGTVSETERASDFYILKLRSGSTAMPALLGMGARFLMDDTCRVDLAMLQTSLKLFGGDVLYYESDAVRTLCSEMGGEVAEEPLPQIKKGDASGITVAVLDTGIDRTHPGFAGATLLSGYDCIEDRPYVTGESNGHGTKVAGVIATYAENVVIMPVKVASNQSMIYSSDLIYALRYAADNGADIINMSFSGYTYSYAEQDAVNYALSKGCVLISSSGNDGLTSYGTKMSYPAAYEGVISVGSTDREGKLSLFSQNSDGVDISCCGEFVTVFENGGYGTDSGTSFSCAAMAAVAAMCKKAASGARYGSDEMLTVIKNVCGKNRAKGLGFGTVNSDAMISLSALPVVCGIEDGGMYVHEALLKFNSGYGFLDGDEVFDGETALGIGPHVLYVENDNGYTVVNFRIIKSNLTYKYNEYRDHAEFVFDTGYGFLDGLPYASGTPIFASGDHVFLLMDEFGRSTGENICPMFGISSIKGAEDGKIYFAPIRISAESGEINGEPFEGEKWIYESGEYTVTTADETITFGLQLDGFKYLALSDDLKFDVSPEHGVVVTYTDGGNGFSVYSAESGEPICFIAAPGIISCDIFGDMLYVACGDGIFVYAISSLLTDEPEPESFTEFAFGVLAVAKGDNGLFILSDKMLYLFDGTEIQEFFAFESRFDTLCACKNILMLCSVHTEGRTVTLVDISDLSSTEVELSVNLLGKSMMLTESTIVCGKTVFSYDGELLYEGEFDRAVVSFGDAIITREGAFDMSGAISEYITPLSDIKIYGDTIWLFDGANLVSLGIEPSSFGGMPVGDLITESHELNRFSDILCADKKLEFVIGQDGRMYAISGKLRKLFIFDAEKLELSETVTLKFCPERLIPSGNGLIITFKNRPSAAFYDGEVTYLTLSFVPEKVCANEEYIYFTSGGRLVRTLADGTLDEIPYIPAKDMLLTDDALFVLDGRLVTAFAPDLSETLYEIILDTRADAMILHDGLIYTGSSVIDPVASGVITTYDREILCISGSYAVTKKGLMLLETGEITSAFETEKAAGSNNTVYIYGKGGIIRNDMRRLEEFYVSIEPEALYEGSAEITFAGGLAFLDHVAIESGHTVTEGGEHVLLICLPFGIIKRYDFSVVPALEGISILNRTKLLDVGGTLPLAVSFLPTGASTVPLKFSVDSDIAEVSEDGVITALSSGTVKVTVSTEDGMFSAEYTIKISIAALKFDEESGLTVDREKGIIRPVPAGRTVQWLRNHSVVEGDITVLDENGEVYEGALSTGMRLLHDLDDDEGEEYIIAVRGDIDRDGYLTASDASELKSILSQSKVPDDVTFAAADVNGSGNITDYDLSVLKWQLLQSRMFNRHPPVPDEIFEGIYAYASSYVGADGYVYLALYTTGDRPIDSIFGKIKVTGATFDRVLSSCGSVETHSETGVSFIIDAAGDSGCILLLRFAAKGKVTFTLESGIVKSEGVPYALPTVECESKRFEYSDKISISVENAVKKLVFDPDTINYSVFLPDDAAFADVRVCLPEGIPTVQGIVLGPDGGTVTVTLPGAGKTYILHIFRTDSQPDDENRLASLKVGEYTFEPTFDPDICEYLLTLDEGAELPEITYATISENANATLDIRDGSFTVTVVAESGSERVYTVNIIRQAPDISDQVSNDTSSVIPAPPEHDEFPWYLLLLLLIPVAVIIVIAAKKSGKKK